MNFQEINFSELDIKEVGMWPLSLRVLIIIVTGLVTLALAYFFIIQNKFAELDTQTELEASKRKEFQDKYNLAANLSAYEKQIGEIKDLYKKTLKQLPSTDQLPELIDSISKDAEANGLQSQSIKPGDPTTILGFYKELPLNLIVVGSYAGFGSFLQDLSNLSRIITIGDFTVKHVGSDASLSKSNSTNDLVLDMQAKTYWLSNEAKPDNSVPAAGATPGLASPVSGPGVAPAPGVPAPGAPAPGAPAPGVPPPGIGPSDGSVPTTAGPGISKPPGGV